MKKIIEYECELCGMTNTNEETIKECEASHYDTKDISKIKFLHFLSNKVPKRIYITFNDNKSFTYSHVPGKKKGDS